MLVRRRLASCALALLSVLGLLVCAAPARAAYEQTSESGRYRVTIATEREPIAVNAWHTWTIDVRRADGKPPRLHTLSFDGGMPAHGHGLPSAPEVHARAEPGRFDVTGMRFNMAGTWALRIVLVDEQGLDTVTFSVTLGSVSRGGERPLTWSARELETLRTLRLPASGLIPKDPSNRIADDPRAVAFGHRLFFDVRLSGDGKSACATCHEPQKHFSDAGAHVRQGAEGALSRDAPSLVGSAHGSWFYWDGRRDSLWSQALVPLEAAAEMATTRLEVVRLVARDPAYRRAYGALFGPLPRLSASPRRASPLGDEGAQRAWAKLKPEQQSAINRAFSNVGKAIAAYERQLVPGESAFDRYVDALLRGEPPQGEASLSGEAQVGLRLFISDNAQCLRCHNGPMLSNGGFHQVGTGNSNGVMPDFGRSLGVQALLAAEFNCLSPYNDDPAPGCPELRYLDRHEENSGWVGAFKVPSLRNASRTAPYMHDGRFATLMEVMQHYRSPRPGGGLPEFQPLFDFTEEHLRALIAFVDALAAPIAVPPELLAPPATP